MRFLFCGIQRKHGKAFWLLPQSPQDAEVLSSFPCHLQPTFSALGPVSMEFPSSLSYIIHCSEFDMHLSFFFPEWAANDVLYYTTQKNLKCQNVFMTTFTYQKHTKLVYTEQDAR